MKKRNFILMFVVLASINFVNAQKETCETPEDNLQDLNSISITKCSVETIKDPTQKKSKRISVKVSASKRNLIRRKRLVKSVTGIGSINTSGIETTKQEAETSKTLFLKTNVNSLKKKLSSAQVRSASAFNEVDQIPLFKSCKGEKGQESLDCFNEQMMLHIQKHFRYPNEAVLKGTQGEVWIRFIIDENGNVTNIKTLGPENGEILTEEATRVVSNLPKFVPATKKGKKVLSKFGFPINFSLEE